MGVHEDGRIAVQGVAGLVETESPGAASTSSSKTSWITTWESTCAQPGANTCLNPLLRTPEEGAAGQERPSSSSCGLQIGFVTPFLSQL